MAVVSDQSVALDSVLRHHLSLDHVGNSTSESVMKEIPSTTKEIPTESGSHPKLKKRVSLKEFADIPPASKDGKKQLSHNTSRSNIAQGTVETDNKRRPVLMKKGSQRFEPPPPEPPDPNSEAKSVTIRRMQSNLEVWEEQLKELYEKKKENDNISKVELVKRDETIQDLTTKYNKEVEINNKTQRRKQELELKLGDSEKTVEDQSQQLQHLQMQLRQYTMAYQQSDSSKQELEEQLVSVNEQLQQSEDMRRRLHEQVAELQGRLALEEQRSKVCSIM